MPSNSNNWQTKNFKDFGRNRSWKHQRIHYRSDLLSTGNISLERLESIFQAEINTPEKDEAEVLSILIEKYEEEHYPIGMPDPIEAIKFRMEQMGMKQKDLAETVGFTSRVSEILSKKRKLTLSMIRKLSTTLHIPAEVLVQEYWSTVNLENEGNDSNVG